VKKPNLEVLKALSQLKHTNERAFGILQGWVLDSAHEQELVLRQSSELHAIFKAQGSISQLLTIAQTMGDVDELAPKAAMNKAGIHIAG